MRDSRLPRGACSAPGDVPFLPLVGLADVDEERRSPPSEPLVRLDGRDLVDLLLDLCQKLSVRRHYFRNIADRKGRARPAFPCSNDGVAGLFPATVRP